nr:MAG TPA: hypothetical protein [Caudoviricetes sp.]
MLIFCHSPSISSFVWGFHCAIYHTTNFIDCQQK